MKKFKAALACILSAAMIASLFPIGYAENQSDTSENVVELTGAQTVGRTLLDINYDDKFREIDRFGSPTTSIVTGHVQVIILIRKYPKTVNFMTSASTLR